MTNHTTTRRGFLGQAGATLLSAYALPAALRASPEGRARRKNNTLVVIYLRGGADALNVVVPFATPNYYVVRPTIAIPAESTADEPGVVKLTDTFGLHPGLKDLHGYWQSGQLSCVVGCGSPHPTRSHFDAQDFMEYAALGDRSVRQGWLNRYLDATKTDAYNPLRALAMQDLLPRSLRGKNPVLAVPRLSSGESEGLLDLFDDVYKNGGGVEADVMSGGLSGGALEGRRDAVNVGRHTIETLRHFWEVVEGPDAPKATAKYPRSALGRRLELIARVIKANTGLEVAAVDHTGYDTHQGQGSTDGSLQRLLSDLGSSLKAFADDLGPDLGQVTVLVMTEFGRTVAENGNRGTDHGRGSCMLALGGAVKGGQVIGDYGPLDRKALQDGRDLRVDIDFRQIFRDLLKGVHGFDAPKPFFPLFTPKEPLGLFKA